MNRVIVIGSGGAGKSRLARELGEILGLPVIHLDAHYWRPGWKETPRDEWREKVAKLAAQPRWVMDGNYGGTMDMRLAACDTVIFLDLPRRTNLWRILKRRLQFAGRDRPDIAPGCPERFNGEFLSWIWSYPSRQRPKILEKVAALRADQRAIVLRSPREVREFLKSAGRETATATSGASSRSSSRTR